MNVFLIFYIIYFIAMLRGIYLAMGRAGVKIFRENFLFWQAIALAACILLFVAGWAGTFLKTITICSALLLAGFYLQPTPRTSRKILILLVILSAVVLAFSYTI